MLAVCLLACGPDAPGGSEGATEPVTSSQTAGSGGVPTTGGSGDATSSSSSSSGGETSGTSTGGDALAQHGACPGGDECSIGALCVQAEGASICGPGCAEYGPGPAAGRCPVSAFQSQSICPLTPEVPGVCLIMCEVAADCPDLGMVCVTCPEPFVFACENLWYFGGAGPNICAWPAV